MTQPRISALLGDLVFKALDHALVDRLDLMTRPADQVMMVMMPVARLDFMPSRPVDPRDALHQFLFLKNRNEPENRGEVAALRAHLFVNIGQGEGNRTRIEQPHNGDPSVGRAQPVLPQPRGGVDGVRFRFRAHGYLYHTRASSARSGWWVSLKSRGFRDPHAQNGLIKESYQSESNGKS